MDRVVKKSIKIPQWLARYRWQIVALICLIILGFEVIEHIFEAMDSAIPFVFELLTFVILLLLVGLLVGDLVNNLNVESRLSRLLEQKHHLSLEMTNARDWQELLEIIYRVPAAVGVNAETYLYLNRDNAYELVSNHNGADTSEAAHKLPHITTLAMANHCATCLLTDLHPTHVIQERQAFSNSGTTNIYCLPLFYENTRFAVLQLHLLQDQPLTEVQIDTLDNIGPEIALALGSGIQRKTLSELQIANAAATTREEISRDLHDTLGQNLSYLRLKLDQFAHGCSNTEISKLQPDLVRMLEITQESNELLRGTLSALHPETQSRLTGLLKQHGKEVSERANFDFQFTSQGKSHPLTATTLRQIFFIYREALNNIESHARATSVVVKLIWKPEILEIQIHDDGLGFDLEDTKLPDHLGLSIMQERMGTLGGDFSIKSAKESGTCITLKLPLES